MSSNRTAWAQARRLLLASAALAALGQNVPAQSSPAPLSLEDAVQKAITAHPALTAQSARVSAAAALVQQAGLRPNPRISLQSENWSLTGADPISTSINSDQFAYFNQTFETASKRDRRVGLSRANHQITGLERDLLERQIASRVKLAYWSAVGTERVRDLWVQQIQNFQQVIQYHEARVKEGAVAEVDLFRVRLEADRYSVSASTAALDAEQARIALFREMGLGQASAAQLTTALDPFPSPTLGDVQQALDSRIELRIAQQDSERATANIRLQRSMATPDIDAGLGYKRNLGFNTMLATIQITLPTFNRNQGNIQAAVSEEAAARSVIAATEARIRSEVASAQKDVDNKQRQLRDLLAGSLDRAAETVRIAEAAYREGGADLLRLLDAERLRIELEVLRVQTLAQYRQSLVNLETALGVNP